MYKDLGKLRENIIIYRDIRECLGIFKFFGKFLRIFDNLWESLRIPTGFLIISGNPRKISKVAENPLRSPRITNNL